MALVGSGCEKAKHHLNPSPKRPKTLRNRKQKTGETLPTEPSKDKDKNVALVGSGCEKAKHHLNPSPKRPTKNATKPEAENWRNVAYGTLQNKDQRQKWLSSAVHDKSASRWKDMSQNKLGLQKTSELDQTSRRAPP